MSNVKIIRVKSKLAAQVFRSGGITASQAVKQAGNGIKSMRDAGIAMVDETLGKIDAQFGSSMKARETEDLEDLYRLSARIIDSSACLPDSGVERAARALCELVDASAMGGSLDWEAVDVHVASLKLLRMMGAQMTAAEREQVLGGLDEVIKKRAGAMVPEAITPGGDRHGHQSKLSTRQLSRG